MKKYVHVWFVLIAVLLSVLIPAAAHAHVVHKEAKQINSVNSKSNNQQKKSDSIAEKKKLPTVDLPDLANLAPDIPLDNIEALISKHKEIDQLERMITLSLNPKIKPKLLQTGTASWYGPRFYGRKTASGEIFTKRALTAAHRTLPFGTKLRVTNQNTGQSVVVKVNDRGPFTGNRVLDLSHAAASAIGMIDSGLCKVKIEKF